MSTNVQALMQQLLRLLALIALVMSGGALPSATNAQVIGAGHVLGNGTASPRTPTDTSAATVLTQSLGSETNSFVGQVVGGTMQNIGIGTGLSISSNVLNLQPGTNSVIGGVEAIAHASHEWINSISNGVPALSQPGFSDLTGSVAPSQCPVFSSSTIGCAPASGGGTANFLRADGSWQPPPGGGGVTTYTGQVATRSYLPTTLGGAAAQQCMARSRHFSRTAITSLQLVYTGWAVLTPSTTPTGTGETNTGATIPITASVEYPAGTFHQVTWSGTTPGSLTSGANLVSDSVSVNIPNNTPFWVRTWINVPAASETPYAGTGISNVIVDTADGEAMKCASPTTPDLTMSGTVTDAYSGEYDIYPAAIIGQTTQPSVFIIGDSIGLGTGGQVFYNGDTGLVAPSIGNKYAYINASASGDRAHNVAGSYTKRLALAAYTTDTIVQDGVNDIYGNLSSAATVETDLNTVYTQFAAVSHVFQTTITPDVAGSSGYSGQTQQTPATNYAARDTLNYWIRSNPPPLTGYFETADQIELWRGADVFFFYYNGNSPGYPGAGITLDGLHPNVPGYARVPASGAINPAMITR